MKLNKYYDAKLNSLEFQKKAFTFFKDKNYGAIFFEQGLGKTKIAIDLTLYWLNKIRWTKCYSCEKNLINNWYDELKKHTGIPVKLGIKYKKTLQLFFQVDVMILNYEIINNEFDRIKTYVQKLGIVLDGSTR